MSFWQKATRLTKSKNLYSQHETTANRVGVQNGICQKPETDPCGTLFKYVNRVYPIGMERREP